MTTWLRGARCTDRRQCRRWKRGPRPKTATVERREASVPRHGTRRASPARQSRLASATTTQVRLSALRPPLLGSGAKGQRQTRAPKRAAGTKKTALFDIVSQHRLVPGDLSISTGNAIRRSVRDADESGIGGVRHRPVSRAVPQRDPVASLLIDERQHLFGDAPELFHRIAHGRNPKGDAPAARRLELLEVLDALPWGTVGQP
jgi:hypothetical protein